VTPNRILAAVGTFGLKVKRPSLERLKVLQHTRTVGSTGLKVLTGPICRQRSEIEETTGPSPSTPSTRR